MPSVSALYLIDNCINYFNSIAINIGVTVALHIVILSIIKGVDRVAIGIDVTNSIASGTDMAVVLDIIGNSIFNVDSIAIAIDVTMECQQDYDNTDVNNLLCSDVNAICNIVNDTVVNNVQCNSQVNVL